MVVEFSKKLVGNLIVIFLLPSFIFVVFKSSLSFGITLSSLLILGLNYKIIPYISFKITSIIWLLLFVNMLVIFGSYIYLKEDLSKPLFSVIIFLIFVSSYMIAYQFLIMKTETIIQSLYFIIILLIIFGWLKLLYTPTFMGYTSSKATFPFAEESHFALTLGMLAVAYSFVARKKNILFILFNSLVCGFIYPSLTLMVFNMLIIFILSIRLKSFKIKIMILVFTLLIIIILFNIEYFSSRLTLTDNTNITTLVFLQGWELAYLNFINTNGLGLGFQMLGSPETVTGAITELISKIVSGRGHLNIEDGGFLAAKIIAEFGFIGVIIVFFYIYWLIKIVFILNRYHGRLCGPSADKKQLLMYGFIFAFLVEMFLRGYGYFSPGVFIVLSSIFTVLAIKSHNRKIVR